MLRDTILVTGHKSPDTDSICSAISYANLKNQMGFPAQPICAGQANKETSFALKYFGFEHPEIVTSFAVTVEDVLETIPAVDAKATLQDVLAWRKQYEMNRIPVVENGTTYVGTITAQRLIDALEGAMGGNVNVTAGEICTKTSCQVISKETKLRDFKANSHIGGYPVVDNGTYYGIIRSNVEAPKQKTKVVLVDHNEKVQIIDDIEEAELIENIDHHRIGGLVTDNPIFIHYETVGCTCTILANLYWQYGQEIPKNIAGLMLSAIISDTVLFRSPTCTEKDKETARKLADIAGVNLEEYGMELLKAGSDVSDYSDEKIVRTDLKEFEANGKIISIGQIQVMDTTDILGRKGCLLKAMEELRNANNYSASYLMITNILTEATNLIFVGDANNVVATAFNAQPVDNEVYLEHTLSRKKQVVPPIVGAMKG